MQIGWIPGAPAGNSERGKGSRSRLCTTCALGNPLAWIRDFHISEEKEHRSRSDTLCCFPELKRPMEQSTVKRTASAISSKLCKLDTTLEGQGSPDPRENVKKKKPSAKLILKVTNCTIKSSMQSASKIRMNGSFLFQIWESQINLYLKTQS